MSCGWWEPLYDDVLADVLLARTDPAELAATVAFLVELLHLEPGDRVFDQCCGIGSTSLPLARRGLAVIAFDQAPGYVERARRDAEAAGLELELRVADAFEHVVRPACRAGFNWWTSFGYADDDARNAAMLRRAFESLEPGGRFALDFMNVPGVLRAFERHTVTRRDTVAGEVVLLRESAIDASAGALGKRWTWFLPDGRRVERTSRVRLYLPNTLVEMLRACGFADVELFGSVDTEPLDLDSPRCICVARRPLR